MAAQEGVELSAVTTRPASSSLNPLFASPPGGAAKPRVPADEETALGKSPQAAQGGLVEIIKANQKVAGIAAVVLVLALSLGLGLGLGLKAGKGGSPAAGPEGISLAPPPPPTSPPFPPLPPTEAVTVGTIRLSGDITFAEFGKREKRDAFKAALADQLDISPAAITLTTVDTVPGGIKVSFAIAAASDGEADAAVAALVTLKSDPSRLLVELNGDGFDLTSAVVVDADIAEPPPPPAPNAPGSNPSPMTGGGGGFAGGYGYRENGQCSWMGSKIGGAGCLGQADTIAEAATEPEPVSEPAGAVMWRPGVAPRIAAMSAAEPVAEASSEASGSYSFGVGSWIGSKMAPGSGSTDGSALVSGAENWRLGARLPFWAAAAAASVSAGSLGGMPGPLFAKATAAAPLAEPASGFMAAAPGAVGASWMGKAVW